MNYGYFGIEVEVRDRDSDGRFVGFKGFKGFEDEVEVVGALL